MKTFVKFILMGLVGAIAGCGSHESKEAHDNGRKVENRGVVENGRGQAPNYSTRIDDRSTFDSTPTCNTNPVNKAAGQAVGAVDAAAARTQQVTSDVNRTAAHVQGEVQQAAGDAAQLSNDAARAVNTAERDIDRLKNAFR